MNIDSINKCILPQTDTVSNVTEPSSHLNSISGLNDILNLSFQLREQHRQTEWDRKYERTRRILIETKAKKQVKETFD